jgi:hypothetical protein
MAAAGIVLAPPRPPDADPYKGAVTPPFDLDRRPGSTKLEVQLGRHPAPARREGLPVPL